MNRLNYAFGASLVAMIVAGSPAVAFAQSQQSEAEPAVESAAQSGIEDIVVTAQRREQNLQKTPLAITAVGSEVLANRQVTDVSGLAAVAPAVNFGAALGTARIAIRGIGYDTLNMGGEGRVAFHVDGFYVSRPNAQLAGFYDVQRIEVLRGPQGTLYGRNATAGAINVITGEPGDKLEGYVRGTAGNYALARIEAAVTVPLSDTVSTRIAVQSMDRGGFGKSTATGEDIDDEHSRAVRGKIRFQPSSTFDVTLSADYFRKKDNSGGYHIFGKGSENPAINLIGTTYGGGQFAADPYDNGSEYYGSYRRIYGFGSTMNLDLGAVKITSLTGYRNSTATLRTDLDGVPADLTELDPYENSKQFTQELRANVDLPIGKFIVGGYYMDEKIFGYNTIRINGIIQGKPPGILQGIYLGGHLHTKATAIFGQADIRLTSRLNLTLGGRFSWEEVSINNINQVDFTRLYSPTNPIIGRTQIDDHKWNKFTPKIGLDYQVTDDIFAYASYSQGFKSGGYTLGNVAPPFLQEDIKSYEAGIRSQFGDTLRVNLSGFYYKYKNIQVSRVVNQITIIDNAASARLYGLEGDIIFRPTSAIQFDAGFSVLKSEFLNYFSQDPAQPSKGLQDLTGNMLPQAPKYTFNLGAQYTLPVSGGEFVARIDSNIVGQTYYTAFNRSITGQEPFAKFDGNLKFSSINGWSLSAFVKNIGNKRTVAYAYTTTGLYGFPVVGVNAPPRTFGLTAEYKF